MIYLKKTEVIALKKTKFTEQQIAFALKQAETGTRVDEVCRQMGISEATFDNWKKKDGGFVVQNQDQSPKIKKCPVLEHFLLIGGWT